MVVTNFPHNLAFPKFFINWCSAGTGAAELSHFEIVFNLVVNPNTLDKSVVHINSFRFFWSASESKLDE